MGRIHIILDGKIEEKFRKKFVRKKGDLSKQIEKLILEKLKLKNETDRNERRYKK